MLINVSEKIINLFKKSKKDYDYQLRNALGSIDLDIAKGCLDVLPSFNDKKISVDISDDNIALIHRFFGAKAEVQDICEKMLWVAALLLEV